MSDNMPKYQIIAEDLRKLMESGELAPGDKVPSVAELRRKYGVSHITVMGAYQRLLKNHFVENHAGLGYFVRKPADSGRKEKRGVIGFGFRPLWKYDPGDQYFNEITYFAQQTCIQSHYSWIQHYSTQCLDNLDGLLYDRRYDEEVRRGFLETADKVDGFLLDGRLPDDFIENLYAKIRKPMVLINRKTEVKGIACIYPPVEESLRCALDLARRLGYQNFILADTEYRVTGSLSLLIRNEFVLYMQNNGIPPEHFRIIRDVNLYSYEELYADLRGQWLKMQPGKTLIISDITHRLYEQLVKNGKVPGQNCGLISTFNVRYTRDHKPQLAAFNFSVPEIGRSAVSMLIRYINTAKQPVQTTPPQGEIFIGETL